jgi:hypothetical protein
MSRQASIAPRTLSRLCEPMICALSGPPLRVDPFLLRGRAPSAPEAGVSIPELLGGGAT